MKGFGFGWSDLGVLGLIGMAIYGGIKLAQMNSIAKKVDMSIKTLSDSTPVEIQKGVTEKAVEQAADREARREVRACVKRIGEAAVEQVTKEVKDEVQRQKADISERVTKQVAEEVKNIHQEELVKKIVDKAEDLVADKIEEERRKAAAKLNKGLESVLDIYDGISKRVFGGRQSNGSEGLTFTVGR